MRLPCRSLPVLQLNVLARAPAGETQCECWLIRWLICAAWRGRGDGEGEEMGGRQGSTVYWAEGGMGDGMGMGQERALCFRIKYRVVRAVAMILLTIVFRVHAQSGWPRSRVVIAVAIILPIVCIFRAYAQSAPRSHTDWCTFVNAPSAVATLVLDSVYTVICSKTIRPAPLIKAEGCSLICTPLKRRAFPSLRLQSAPKALVLVKLCQIIQ